MDFRDSQRLDLNDIIDPENVIEIDIDGISDEALKLALSTVSNLGAVYFDEEFIKNNPKLKTCIDSELENLRVLIKMRKTDEVTHDILVKAIGANASNASLYKSLAQMQSTLLSIQKQMDDTIDRLRNALKNVQLELSFTDENDSKEDEDKNDSNVHRGSKSFIEQMKNADHQNL